MEPHDPTAHCLTVYAKHTLEQPHSIRVVDLERPDSPGDPIRLNLRVVELAGERFTENHGDTWITWASPSPYQTLSYVWGINKATDWIYLDGLKFPVTENLHCALKRIRNKVAWDDGDRNSSRLFAPTIWIDAICINQADIIEKSEQVKFMDMIYFCAKRLIIWLGDGCDDESASLRRAIIQRESSAEDIDSALRSLIQAPWFQRRWVVQELMFSNRCTRHVLFGQASFRFEQMVLCLRSCETFREHFTDSVTWYTAPPLIQLIYTVNPARSIFELQHRHGSRRNLLQNLTVYAGFECGLRADRIISLMGLSDDADIFVSQFGLEYDNTDGGRSVFTKFAKYYLTTVPNSHTTKSVMLIYASATAWSDSTMSGSVAGLPSWAPDWAAEDRYSSSQHLFLVDCLRKEVIANRHSERFIRAFSSVILPIDTSLTPFPQYKAPEPTEEDEAWTELREIRMSFELDTLMLDAFLLWPCQHSQSQVNDISDNATDVEHLQKDCAYCHLADDDHRWPMSSESGSSLVDGELFLPELGEGRALIVHMRWRFALVVIETPRSPDTSRSYRLDSRLLHL